LALKTPQGMAGEGPSCGAAGRLGQEGGVKGRFEEKMAGIAGKAHFKDAGREEPMKRQKVRDRWQIALYVPQELVRPLKAEARKQKRAHSATVVEILRHYFGEQEVSKPDAAQPAAQ